jgi:methylated-DNA-protein-cysteine methyltransferase-like protein
MAGFFDQVYWLVRQVPRGRVVSYGAVARMLGRPRAARTVGWALSSLPAGSDVPWHRVVNSRGSISLDRYGGLQRALLEEEGVVFSERGAVDFGRFGWAGLPWPEVEAGLRETGLM